MSDRYSNTNYFKKKTSKKATERENFLQLYNRTCHRIYFYAYDLSGNTADADAVFRDAFIYMHQHIAELRSSKSLDAWQKECVEKAFRALLRSQLLKLVRDEAPVFSASSVLSEGRKEELWGLILKMSDIDPWRMVPIPGKSTIFSVIADQTISDLRYMSIGDILKSVLLIFILVIAIIFVIVIVVDFISSRSNEQTITSQEIFLDERYYSDYDLSSTSSLSQDELNSAYQGALKYDVDDEGNRITHTAPANIGNTAGTPTYTDDPDINTTLISTIDSIINDDLSDFDKLRAIYIYVGGYLEYREYPSENSRDSVGILKDCFEYRAGTSQHYAVFLSSLCCAAGYDCDVVKGIFYLNRGTEFEQAVEHYWCSLSLNGISYYLDIEADCDSTGTTVREYYFMAADGNSKWDIFERDHKWQ